MRRPPVISSRPSTKNAALGLSFVAIDRGRVSFRVGRGPWPSRVGLQKAAVQNSFCRGSMPGGIPVPVTSKDDHLPRLSSLSDMKAQIDEGSTVFLCGLLKQSAKRFWSVRILSNFWL